MNCGRKCLFTRKVHQRLGNDCSKWSSHFCPGKAKGQNTAPIQTSQFSVVAQLLSLLWVLWQPFMDFWIHLPLQNLKGRQCEHGSSSQLTCSWGSAVAVFLWKELTVHPCCERFGSDYLSAVRYCSTHRENKVECGGHITADTDRLNQMQKDETHMIYWHMTHRLESDQERSAKITKFSVPKRAC